MRLGKIVKSNSHNDYVCQIDGPGDVPQPPRAGDYAFGTFISISLDDGSGGCLVGLVYSTILMNPDFGTLGPRLSTPAELEVFSPDYLNETVTVIGILAVGQVDAHGQVLQGVPRLAASVNAVVETMDADQIRSFHAGGEDLSLAYVPLLLGHADPLVGHLLLNVVDQVKAIFPEHQRQLSVLRGNLAWKLAVAPAG